MTFAELQTRVRGIVNLGTTADAFIPNALRDALRMVERQHDLQYMDRWFSFTIDKDKPDPRLLALPGLVKAFRFIRIMQASGVFLYLPKVEPMDHASVGTGMPSGFYLDGVTNIVLDNTPTEDYAAELGVRLFTDQAALVDGSEHWLFENGADALCWGALYSLGPILRDQVLMLMAKAMRDEAVRSVFLADEALRNSEIDGGQQLRYENG